MKKRKLYKLIYAPAAHQHVRVIETKYHSLIRRTIEEQLLFEPDIETHNRKPLKKPVFFAATWEIRFGPDNRFRVYYDVNEKEHTVAILAIGVKIGNRLKIGNEEVEI
jgi:mRNA-degrading endonuclease RelE of RelBE toxin-antitoxin system